MMLDHVVRLWLGLIMKMGETASPRRQDAASESTTAQPIVCDPALAEAVYLLATKGAFLLLPARVDCGAHFRRRHRQFGQPRADSALDRVGDGRHRRADVDL